MMDEVARRRVVRACLWVTRGTAIAADRDELRLLVRFIWGELTIDQVCDLANSRFVRPTTAPMLRTAVPVISW